VICVDGYLSKLMSADYRAVFTTVYFCLAATQSLSHCPASSSQSQREGNIAASPLLHLITAPPSGMLIQVRRYTGNWDVVRCSGNSSGFHAWTTWYYGTLANIGWVFFPLDAYLYRIFAYTWASAISFQRWTN